MVGTASYVGMNFVQGGTWSDLTLRGFATSAGMGALSGAMGGGFSVLANSLGSFGQSMAYGMLSNMATTVATNVAFGNRITWGTIAGSAIGGVIDGSVAQFKGFKFSGSYNFGKGLVNGISELGINTLRGGLVGGISGSIGAMVDGGDPGEGFAAGFRSGAVSGAGKTAINLAVLGPAIRPTGKAEAALIATEKDLGINLLSGAGSPVYRAGGLMKLIAPGITIGRSLMVGTDMESNFGVNTWVHESYHFYQQLTQGIAGQLAKGMKEQWWLRTFKGIEVYDYSKYGTKYNESAAAQYANSHYPW